MANRVVGEVEGRICVLVDDMIDTGGTIVKAAEALIDARRRRRHHRRDPRDPLRPRRRPAEELPGQRGRSSPTPCRSPPEQQFDKLTVLSIAPLISRAIREVFEDGSVTSLFDGQRADRRPSSRSRGFACRRERLDRAVASARELHRLPRSTAVRSGLRDRRGLRGLACAAPRPRTAR